MRIVQFFSHSGINGVTTSGTRLIRDLHARGHELMLIHRPGAWLAETLSDLPIRFLPAKLTTRPRELRALRAATEAFGADVIHTHGASAHKHGAILRIIGRVPVVATAHSTKPLQAHWMFNSRVIAPSERAASFHRRANFVRRSNIRIIPNAFDASGVMPADAAAKAGARAALGLGESTFVLGMTGHVDGRKNQIDAVRVLAAVRARGVDAVLALIGHEDAGYGARLGRVAAELGVTGQVLRLGERKEAVALLAALDVFLFTSRDEVAPVAPIEAMAAGVPIVTTRVGHMALLLEGALPGHLFAVGDVEGMAARIVALAGDEAARTAAGVAARRIVIDELSSDVILPRIEAVYAELVPEASAETATPSASSPPQ